MTATNTSKSWLDGLNYRVPDDFDYSVIRSVDDVESLMVRLPNAQRGWTAPEIWERREQLDKSLVFAAMLTAWDHDHHEVIEAFDSEYNFVKALAKVAPEIRRKRRLTVYRGIALRHGDPGELARGVSWTRSRDIACWFATVYHTRDGNVSAVRPVVLRAVVEPWEIVAFHKGRREQEVIVSQQIFWDGAVRVDGTNIAWEELEADSCVPASTVEEWRVAGLRYGEKIRRHREELINKPMARTDADRREPPRP
jgi:hypothetical protein